MPSNSIASKSGRRTKVAVGATLARSDGTIIVRSLPIQPPEPPQCVKFKCLWKFFLDTLFCSLESTYHGIRCEYAQKNKDKKIPEKYKTGNPRPKNIKQAIIAIIKLKLRR